MESLSLRNNAVIDRPGDLAYVLVVPPLPGRHRSRSEDRVLGQEAAGNPGREAALPDQRPGLGPAQVQNLLRDGSHPLSGLRLRYCRAAWVGIRAARNRPCALRETGRADAGISVPKADRASAPGAPSPDRRRRPDRRRSSNRDRKDQAARRCAPFRIRRCRSHAGSRDHCLR